MHKKVILGRKRKESIEKGVHDKYSPDNITQRFKCNFIKVLKGFTNEKICEIYEGNIGHGIFKKELLDISNSVFNSNTIISNLNLLNKNIGDIFSNKLNNKFSSYKLDYNINLINELKNEPDIEKKEKLNQLLNSSLLKCLEHLRGTKFYKELEGLECKYEDVFNDLAKKGETEDYINNFKDMIYNYEKYLMFKKPRKSKKKNQKIK